MKKLFIVIFLFISIISWSTHGAYAAVTPSATPTPGGLEQQISDLKDKIASRVAQLKLVDKRGLIGVVIDVTQTQITLTDIHGNTRFVDVDELTKFTSPSAKSSFGISDITKGTTLGVLGLYNKESRRILARFVTVLILPTNFSGAVSDVDTKNFTVTVVTANKKTYSVDVESDTKTNSFDGTSLIKAGFSKIQQGQRIMVIGYADAKDPKHITASRILLFPTLPIDPSITIIKPEDLRLKGTIVPATGSGVKLTPLKK